MTRMFRDVLTPRQHVHSDPTLVLVGIGSLGQRVVQILRADLERLQFPPEHFFPVTFVHQGPVSNESWDAVDDHVVRLRDLDVAEYVAREDNESLREALLPPASGLITSRPGQGSGVPARQSLALTRPVLALPSSGQRAPMRTSPNSG